ncbi:MAG: hypothetical protein ISR55_07245 [Bacteroidetes bacterium]|nr:hypothetical protein [Bacteroidota bacterium]
MSWFFLVIFGFLFSQISFAQNELDSNSHEEMAFINHWISIEEYSDAIYLIDHYKKENLPLFLRDSLNYLKGWSYYHLKELDSSLTYLDQVSPASAMYHKSSFFSAFNESYLGRPSRGLDKLSNSFCDSSYFSLRNFEMSGMHLLERDTISFLALAKDFNASHYQFAKEEKNLMEYYQQLNEFKDKSMFVAGMLSAIMPGSGKVYAGRLGDGISSFLITSSIAFVALENIRKDGLIDPKSIFFTGLFGVFYVGNIWGSVFSVQMQREEFNNEINHNILFDLHIPLRRIFF